MKSTTFYEALDIIEFFPKEQRESIVEIVKRWLTEERRELLAQTIKKAREKYAGGEVSQGTVDDLKGKLSGSWACNATYNLRVVFDFVKAEK
ncbi:MAG: hypothetical protein AVO38_08025 [delta proteobacterium ML8_D]|jgi:hypothetical protein|nr:MAG: hypothetical protein AVO38_08025 [delta proteobacterium ML8_D]